MNQETRVYSIGLLHEQLRDRFDRFGQVQRVQWYDNGLEPAFLHRLFDRLVEEVSLLISGLDVDDHELAVVRAGDADPFFRKYHRSRSMTVLVERYSVLIDTLRSAAQVASTKNDWGLTDICSELAQRFEESLWFIVVYLQDNWCDEATNSTSTGEQSPQP